MPGGGRMRTVAAMSRLEVRPLAADDLPAAAALLAARHRAHRSAVPALSALYEDAAEAEKVLPSLADSSGAAAFRDGQMVAYVLGSTKTSPAWGPNMWIESAGTAASDPEALRDAYALAAQRWVDEGLTAHYVLMPATDPEIVRVWYRLGFGQQHAHAIRAALPSEPSVPDGLVIRRAERDDIPVLAELDVALPHHQGLSPTFSAGATPTIEESLESWAEDFDDTDYTTFVAVRDGAVIGTAIGCALEKSSMHIGPARVPDAAFLGFAAVLPAARGAGAGRALGEAVLRWAAWEGFTSVVTDWRVTNLLSSRAWPALGFTETFVRLHRAIGY
jgi:GNAT superfamily N-acetyltransferase